MKRAFAGFFGLALVVACGGGAGVPATTPNRESGQSGLMEKTFAGQNKCNAKNHERPFIVEWDATDASSFESRASTDLVFVKYEGCELKVLDECADEAIRGTFGTYRPVDWTSGGLEKIDIKNEGELFAKLPLGVASLGARVSAGEQFHMEYYVAGVRTATRGSVYRKDLARIPACKGATHFVFGYNLGAFALASAKNIDGEVGASAFGFGAGGKAKHESAAEKKGGLLSRCHGESAKEVEGCKAPIRLTLREISESDNPDAEAMRAPDNKASLNAAGKVDRELTGIKKANAFSESARQKWTARDGKGCLADLDSHDRLDPEHKSTNPKQLGASMRSWCLMLAGQCDAGKDLDRKSSQNMMPNMAPDMLDNAVNGHASDYCPTGSIKDPRARARKDAHTLTLSNVQKVSAGDCLAAYRSLKATRDATNPKPTAEQDHDLHMAFFMLPTASSCLAKAGDCKNAWAAYQDLVSDRRADFDTKYPTCKGQ